MHLTMNRFFASDKKTMHGSDQEHTTEKNTYPHHVLVKNIEQKKSIESDLLNRNVGGDGSTSTSRPLPASMLPHLHGPPPDAATLHLDGPPPGAAALRRRLGLPRDADRSVLPP